MIPQIFISSTFYDLKYVRESLGDFVKSFGFEPILFENGDVGYTYGEELDLSCYRTIRFSDMAILIIGGRYGSPASEENMTETKFGEFLSVTRKEFNTAVQSNIPVYCFVEESVFNEYQIYAMNKDKFESGCLNDIKFRVTENINVFRFVESIYDIKIIPVFEFKEIRDIKDILRKQWADMFKTYLIDRKNGVHLKEIEPAINQIYTVIQSMNVMLQDVGKKLVGSDETELKTVLDKQYVENVAGKIACAFEFVSMEKRRDKIKEYLEFFIEQLILAKKKNILEYPFSDNFEDIETFYSMFEYRDIIISSVKSHLQFDEDIKEMSVEFKALLVDRLMCNDYLRKMKFVN